MKSRKIVVVVGVAAFILIALGIGTVAFLFRPGAPTVAPPSKTPVPVLYSGVASPVLDTGSQGLGHCQRALDEAGRGIRDYYQINHKFLPFVQEMLSSQPACPVTRHPYGWVTLGDRALLYCADSPHLNAGQRLRPVFDCSKTEATADWKPENQPFDLYARIFVYNAEADLEQAEAAALAYIQTPGAIFSGWDEAIRLDAYRGSGKSLELLSRASQRFPEKKIELSVAKVRVLYCAGQLDEARTLARAERSTNEAAFDSQLAFLALAQGDMAESIRLLRDDAAFKTMVYFAQRDFKATQEVARQGLEKFGYGSDGAIYEVEYLTLAGKAIGGDGEKLARETLAAGINNCRRVWPFPLLQFLNGELGEEALLKLAGSSKERQGEAHACLGYWAALAKDTAGAKAHFEKCRQTIYWEGPMTAAWLKTL